MRKLRMVLVCLGIATVFLFAGCTEKKQEPLRVCVDADAFELREDSCKETMESFLATIAQMGGPSDVVLEVLPSSGTERDTALQNIRTEVMSGAGPDLFIVLCGGSINSGEALFEIPEKIVQLGVFLPLDEYIENAQFMEWDKYTSVVMDAGRTDEGQLILPLTYTLPLTFYRASDIPGVKPDVETTWENMLTDQSGILKAAASWMHHDDNDFVFMPMSDNYIEYTFGKIADYESEKLLFSEDELLQRTNEILEMQTLFDSNNLHDIPDHYQTKIYPGFTWPSEWGTLEPDSHNGIRFEEEQTMIPIYSEDGGTTAEIVSFAAINANTRRAEDAFYILDFMMSPGNQRYFDLYELWLGDRSAIPVCEGILREDTPIGLYYLTNANYAEFSRVRGQITQVRFRGGLSEQFDYMYRECMEAKEAGMDIAPVVSKYYDKLKQMISE